ncbi:MFS transporter [Rhodococcus sp. NPDC058514]|uniref:MFS transporter n=1 Tax=unclassified Rhodococcus (in: high G+C Gram-positive bacteria) TaxID=192944 RepID=UPI00366A256E
MVAQPLPGGSPADTAAQRWTPRLIFSLASLVLLLEMLAVSYMMISMALPAIAGHYQTTQGAWLLTSFLLVGAVTAPLIGKLADMYGKRKLLLACVAIAALGSLLSALAGSYAVLIAGRALSGLLVPCLFLSYSLIRDVFPAKTIALAVSIATSGMGLIAIPAPFLTGWLIDNHGFRSIFWFFVIGLVILAAMIIVSTDESPVRLRSSIDLLGAVLLGAGIAGVLIAVSFGPTWGWKSGSTLAYLFGGVALLLAWLATAKFVREPLIDLNVLGRRPVLLTAISAGFVYGSSGLFTILLPMMAMTPAILGLGYGFGVSAEGFAIFQAPIGLMVVIGGVLVGMLVGRNVRPRPLLVIGLLGMALGFALTAMIHDNKALLIVFAGVFGTGMGMAYASIPNLLIEAVPPQLQASTASIVGVFQSVFPAVLPVIAFTVMNNSHIAPIPLEMTQGAILYTDKGYQIAFLIGAVAAALGAVVALLLPRKIEQVKIPASQIADEPAMVAVD